MNKIPQSPLGMICLHTDAADRPEHGHRIEVIQRSGQVHCWEFSSAEDARAACWNMANVGMIQGQYHIIGF